ncbi:MAG: DUF4293 domain-containing protein [Bacteroides sp.]|nr:DUF4293 domain-containing protein [Bacteroides sp.]
MIQRIQTIYMLLVTALLIATLFLPLGNFINFSGMAVLKPLGVTMDGTFQSTWGLFTLLLLSAIISLGAIFLFKNRILQIRMCVFSMVIMIGFYLVFGFFWYMLQRGFDGTFSLGFGLCLPLIAIILNYLAIRAIGKDEFLVRAADRLR